MFSKKKKFLLFFPIIYLVLFSFSKLDLNNFSSKYQNDWSFRTKQLNDILILKIPHNLKVRLVIYKDYLITEKKFINYVIGSNKINLMKKHNSSHNILIDYLYLFGIFPCIALIYILFRYFLKSLYKSDKFFYLFMIFLIFLFFENMFKVSLRQPYSGILSFIILGLFLNFYKNREIYQCFFKE